MVHSNFHMHSTWCDGKNTLEEMVVASIGAGLKHIGFTGHQPLPYANDFAMTEAGAEAYIKEVRHLKAVYGDRIAISLGMEIDYFLDTGDIGDPAKRLLPELDFFIGSIHTVGFMKDGVMADIDYTEAIFERGIEDCYGGSARAFVEAYYRGIGDVAHRLKPDMIGHIDLVKKNNTDHRFFDENADWYHRAAGACLDAVAETDCIVEVNTGGMIRYGHRCLYPSEWLMGEIYARGIPITLNGDSHSVEAVRYAYDSVTEKLLAIGFKEIQVFQDGSWHPETL